MHKRRAESLLLLACWVCAGGAGSAIAGWAGQGTPAPAATKSAPTPPARIHKLPATRPAAQAQRPTAAARNPVAPAKKATAPARAAKPTPTSVHRAAKPTAEVGPAPGPKKEEKELPPVAGHRDPFKSPFAFAGSGGEPGPTPEPIAQVTAGTRGLVISQLHLEGIVRLDTSNTMIAVVSNARKVAQFLRENDPVYNGVVSKITPDAVFFKENHLDVNGQVTTVEVVKRLSPAPGEGK